MDTHFLSKEDTMKTMKTVLFAIAIVAAAALPVVAAGQADTAAPTGALAFDVQGPDRWEAGHLNRLLIELVPASSETNAIVEPVRVTVPAAEDYVVLPTVPTGDYTVAMVRFGLPDGSFSATVPGPATAVTVEASGVTVAPFAVHVAATADAVSWPEISAAERLAVEDAVRQDLAERGLDRIARR